MGKMKVFGFQDVGSHGLEYYGTAPDKKTFEKFMKKKIRISKSDLEDFDPEEDIREIKSKESLDIFGLSGRELSNFEVREKAKSSKKPMYLGSSDY